MFDFSTTPTNPSDSKKSKEKKEYLKRGCHTVTVKKMFDSKEDDNFRGKTHNIKYLVENEDGISYITFWQPKEGDTKKSKDWKNNQIMTFLMNCGVADFSDSKQALIAAIDKEIQVSLITEEYLKDDGFGTLEKKDTVKYRWSAKIGNQINDANDNLLSEEDLQRLNSKQEVPTQEFHSGADVDENPFG